MLDRLNWPGFILVWRFCCRGFEPSSHPKILMVKWKQDKRIFKNETAISFESEVFWYMTLCRLANSHRRFDKKKWCLYVPGKAVLVSGKHLHGDAASHCSVLDCQLHDCENPKSLGTDFILFRNV